MRWDNWTPYSEKYDRLVNLDLNNYVGKYAGDLAGQHDAWRTSRVFRRPCCILEGTRD